MDTTKTPRATDDSFFAALIARDEAELNDILTDDFIMIDVMSGSEIPKAVLIELACNGPLVFEAIEPTERHVRIYSDTAAVVTGVTHMTFRYNNAPVSAKSRYTHVLVVQDDKWRLASAQGTQVADVPAA